MGLLKKIAHYFMEKPSRAQITGAIVYSVPFINSWLEVCMNFYKKGYMRTIGDGLELGADIGLFFAGMYLTGKFCNKTAALARNFFWNDADRFWPRRQKDDAKIRKEIMKTLSLEEMLKSIEHVERKNFITSPKEDALVHFSSEKSAKKIKSPYLSFNAATIAFSERYDFSNALLFIKNFFEFSEGKIFDAHHTDFSVDFIPKPRKLNFNIYTRNIFAYFDIAVYKAILGKSDEALFYSTLCAEFFDEINHPGKLEARILDSFFSSSLKSTLASNKWKKTLELTKDLPEWERIGESRSVVKVLSSNDFLKKTVVFKESDNLDALINEAETADYFRNELNIDSIFPLYVNQEKIDGKYHYVMAGIEADSLLFYLEKNRKKHFKKVIKTLAKIHFESPLEKIAEGNLDIAGALEKRINNPYLSLDYETKINFMKGYSVLIPLFEKYECLWRYNKDAHPENWMISKNGVFVVDTENANSAPVTFDLANLLGYGNYFSDNEMDKYVSKYFDIIKSKYDIDIYFEDFHLLFLNSLIHRSFFLSSAWSDPERESLHDKRKFLTDNAISALDRIKEEHSGFYNENKLAYLSLHKAIYALNEQF